ncbi:hypothetical protein BO70DRAFT_363435 [Aspergillus heteromorphus CBS 117.55]|uniref:Uncharacterized protein n=1 Tax=Aspergillus heteromorphus CBS 117.55 TaxID=1448321 RepID=A0A317VWW2_9EURO|nr:uncharacterized protein BO70DRAFT_363435 [Aspergillus heteromorphus CBS 117.55]PWY77497.1 hypothetical protein BO70DRAFT_363435 [Aspergillus heteromorphus CBS 117.55]
MRCADHESAIPKDIQNLSLGILYVVACVLCLLALVQRIRRRPYRHFSYAPLERQMMDPPSSPSEKRPVGGIGGGGGGSGGEEPADAAVGQGYGYGYGVASHGVGPFPSACDILQPLSHLSPLPSSGYLAAVLARERSSWAKQSYPREDHFAPSWLGEADSAASPGQDRRPAPTSVTDNNSVGDSSPGGRNRSDNHGGNAPPQTGRTSPAGWRPECPGQGVPSIANLIGAQPSQKCGYAVQSLHDVDEEGVRTWRRLMIEYN